MPRIRRSILALAAVLAACDGRGPLDIEPEELAGTWAGSAVTVSVRPDCAEQSSQTAGFDGSVATVYSLTCHGAVRDAARGVDTRASFVGPAGEVGGPEIVTPLDSVPLVLRRQ